MTRAKIYHIKINYTRADKNPFQHKVYAADKEQAREIGLQLFRDKIVQDGVSNIECLITEGKP